MDEPSFTASRTQNTPPAIRAHPLAAALPPRPKCSWAEKPKTAFGSSPDHARGVDSPDTTAAPAAAPASTSPGPRIRTLMATLARSRSSAQHELDSDDGLSLPPAHRRSEDARPVAADQTPTMPPARPSSD